MDTLPQTMYARLSALRWPAACSRSCCVTVIVPCGNTPTTTNDLTIMKGWWTSIIPKSTCPRPRRLINSVREGLATERTFFRRNKHRMSYACFGQRGLPIGSGPVEAACKSIVKTRLCRSGMRWLRQGGQRILDFRCHVKSGLWKGFWDTYRQIRRLA